MRPWLPLLLFTCLGLSGVAAQPQYATFRDALDKDPLFKGYTLLPQAIPTYWPAQAATLNSTTYNGILLVAPDSALNQYLAAGTGFPSAQLQSLAQIIIGYHTIPQAANAVNAQLPLGNGKTVLPTLLSSDPTLLAVAPPNETLSAATFQKQPDGTYYVAANVPGAILDPAKSVAAAKGRIYALTSMLLPVSGAISRALNWPLNFTVYDVISANPQFSEFKQLVDADAEVLALAKDNTTSYTVFAPVNPAISTALKQLGVSNVNVRAVLLSHFVPARAYTSADIPATLTSAGSTPTTLNVTKSTSAAAVSAPNNTAPIPVTQPDLGAAKSVIHGIAGVLNVGVAPLATAPTAVATPTPTPAATITYPNLTAAFAALPQLAILESVITQVANVSNVFFGNPDLQVTLLAPTSDAFFNTLTTFSNAATFQSNQSAASAVIFYHVITNNGAALDANGTITNSVTLPTLLADDTSRSQSFFQGTTTTVTLKPNTNATYPEMIYVGGQIPGAAFNISKSILAGKSRIYLLEDYLIIPPSTVLVDPKTTPLTTLSIKDAVAQLLDSQLSTFFEAVRNNSQLFQLFSDPDAQITVFAPTDRAFRDAQESGVNLQDPNLLANHVISAGRPLLSSKVPATGITVTTSGSSTIQVASSNGLLVLKGPGNTAVVTTIIPDQNKVNVPGRPNLPDIHAGKSTLYIIDGVILTTPAPGPLAGSLSVTSLLLTVLAAVTSLLLFLAQ